jgi:hypothetical protein
MRLVQANIHKTLRAKIILPVVKPCVKFNLLMGFKSI